MGGFFHDVSNGLETKVTAIEPFLYSHLQTETNTDRKSLRW